MISIADAKNQLPALVHQAEAGRAVTISRRGKAVAVMVSVDEYVRLQQAAQSAPSWMARLDAWREQMPTDVDGLTGEELAAGGNAEIFTPRIDFGGDDFADIDERVRARQHAVAEPPAVMQVGESAYKKGA